MSESHSGGGADQKKSPRGRRRAGESEYDDDGEATLSLLASRWSELILASSSDDDDEGGTRRLLRAGGGGGGGGGDAAAPAIAIEAAVRRTVRLLRGGEHEVPFLCRYRADVVEPLTAADAHRLRELVERHAALESLRRRALRALEEDGRERGGGGGGGSDGEREEIRRRMMASTSRSELEELYAPYKPPARGSLSERISSARRDVAEAVERFWTGRLEGDGGTRGMERFVRSGRPRAAEDGKSGGSDDMSPRDCVVHLLGSKIAANPLVFDAVMGISRRECIVAVKRASSTGKAVGKKGGKYESKGRSKYEQYFDFSCRASSLKDHTVLAIRRGVNAKELRMTNSVPDPDYVKRRIRQTLLEKALPRAVADYCHRSGAIRCVMGDAIEDSWSRLLKRRSSSAVWREKVAEAERRAIGCFAENLRGALMMPPLRPAAAAPAPPRVLAIDPGHGAGAKVALIDPRGRVLGHPGALSTVHFLGGRRQGAVRDLAGLLRAVRSDAERAETSASSSVAEGPVVVALGNGHGSDDSRALIEEASSQCGIPIDVRVVNEAGASVWSVTDAAAREFPGVPPASVGAVSIGRRLQDPMSELVRVPPRSLGLGMYQHDLPEKELDDALKHASIDAVALVGVDGNSASLELLRNVPGLSRGKLAEGVIAIRPLRCREDLHKVKGLGPKCFENCAGFIRVRDGSNALDSTRVHPESYPVARWVMKELECDLSKIAMKVSSVRKDEKAWDRLLSKATHLHGENRARIENIINLLADNTDPRLTMAETKARRRDDTGAKEKPSRLPSRLASSLVDLKDACPVRNVEGRVRNVTDFGVFVDFGLENDGLLHVSKAGPNGLKNMAVGEVIGVDIIGVCIDSGRVSLSLAGLGCGTIQEPTSKWKRKSTLKAAPSKGSKRCRR